MARLLRTQTPQSVVRKPTVVFAQFIALPVSVNGASDLLRRRTMTRRFPLQGLEQTQAAFVNSSPQSAIYQQRFLGPRPPLSILPLPTQQQQTIKRAFGFAASERRHTDENRFPLQGYTGWAEISQLSRLDLSQSYPGGGSNFFGNDPTGQAVGQRVAWLGGRLQFVDVSIATTGSVSDNVVIEIQGESGTSSPDGNVLASVTVSGASFPTNPSRTLTRVDFSASGVTLNPALRYWVVARRTGAEDPSNFYIWFGESNPLTDLLDAQVLISGVWTVSGAASRFIVAAGFDTAALALTARTLGVRPPRVVTTPPPVVTTIEVALVRTRPRPRTAYVGGPVFVSPAIIQPVVTTLSVNFAAGLAVNQRRAQQRQARSKLLGVIVPVRPPVVTTLSVNLASDHLRRHLRRFPLQGWEQTQAFFAVPAPTTQAISSGPQRFVGTHWGGTSLQPAQLAQKFTHVRGVVTSAQVYLSKNGAPTDNVVVEIRPDVAGAPSRTVVLATSSAVPAASLTTADVLTTVTFAAPIEVTGPVWIVLTRDGAYSDTNFYQTSDSTAVSAEGAKATCITPGGLWTVQTGLSTVAMIANFTPFAPQAIYQQRFLGPRPPMIVLPVPSLAQQTIETVRAFAAWQRANPNVRRPHSFLLAPQVLAQPPPLERTVRVTLAHTRPRQQVARLAAPATLAVFAGPSVKFVRTRPRATISRLPLTIVASAQTFAGPKTSLVGTRPRHTAARLAPPTVVDPTALPAIDQRTIRASRLLAVAMRATMVRRFPLQGWEVLPGSSIPVPLGVADNFDRADEGSLAGDGIWGKLDPTELGNLALTGNQVSNTSSQPGKAYYLGTKFLDFEAVLTVTTLPTPLGAVWLNGRLAKPGGTIPPDNVDPTWSGYEFGIANMLDATTCNFTLDRVTNGSSRAIATNGPFPISDGDKIQLRIVGGTIEGSYFHDGVWTQVCLAIDSTYISAGEVGMEIQGSTVARVDNFIVTPINSPASSQAIPYVSRFLGPRPPLIAGQPLARPTVIVAAPHPPGDVNRREPHSFLRTPQVLAQPPPNIYGPQTKPVRIRPRHTLGTKLAAPTVIDTVLVRTLRVALTRARPRPTLTALAAPIVLATFSGPKAPLVKTRPRPIRSQLFAPRALQTFAAESVEDQVAVTLVERPRYAPHSRLFAPTVIRVPSVELREQTVAVTLVRTRPRPTTRALKAPTVLSVFSGPFVSLVHTRPRPTTKEIFAPTVLRVPSVEQQEQTIRVALTRTRPRPTSKRLAAPTVLRVPSVEQREQTITVATVRTRPRPTTKILEAPTVLFRPPVRPDLVTLAVLETRAQQKRRFPLQGQRHRLVRETGSTVTYQQRDPLLGPRPPQIIDPLPSQSQQTVKVLTVALRTGLEQKRHFPLPGQRHRIVRETGSTVTCQMRDPLLGVRPPQIVNPLPDQRQQTIAAKLVAVRTRIEQQRHASHFDLFPPTVVERSTFAVGAPALVRTRPSKTRSFLSAPTTLRVFAGPVEDEVFIRTVVERPRHAPHSFLRAPIVLAVFAGPEVALARIRPRATTFVLAPPSVIVVPSIEQQEETIRVTLAWRTRTEVSRRAAHSRLSPPVFYAATSQIRTALVRTRPRPIHSLLSQPRTYRATSKIATSLVRTRPRAMHSHLAALAVTTRAPVETRIRVALVRTRPRGSSPILAAPAVVTAQVERPLAIALARIRPPKTNSVLRAPTVVNPRVEPTETKILVALAVQPRLALLRRGPHSVIPKTVYPTRAGVTFGIDVGSSAGEGGDIAGVSSDGSDFAASATEGEDKEAGT